MAFRTFIYSSILSLLSIAAAQAQTGRYELLDQGEALKVFSAPVGSKIKVIRNGQQKIIVKRTITVTAAQPRDVFVDLKIIKQLPGFSTSDIRFEFGSARLTSSAISYLNQLGPQIQSAHRANPNLTLLVAGYTDAVGSAAYNLNLSARRAAAVQTYLTTTFGLPHCLLNSVSFGEQWEGLLVKTKYANAMNRRVEIRSTDVLQNASTGLPFLSCGGQSGQVTEQIEVVPAAPLAGGSYSSLSCNAQSLGSNVSLTLKGFNNEEFLGHLSQLWAKLSGYKAHQLVESTPDYRLYALQLQTGNCEIIDDISRHLMGAGFDIDKNITISLQGAELRVEKL